ncbi:MAG: nitrogen fixation protein FixH [Lentimonas sp.]|jgi:nitrogen fixation protein FixH
MKKPINKDAKFALIIFISFFSVFIIVDIAYIIVSQKTWRGLAVEDGYKKGLQYNKTIEKVQKQKDLGWNLKIDFESSGDHKGDLKVRLSDENGDKIQNAKLISKFKRPIQEGYDFDLELSFDVKDSVYHSKVDFKLKGQWDIEIVAIKDNNVYQKVKRLIVQ